MSDVSFVWLEITGKCQLECVHCYADSGPAGSHGQMRTADWKRVIDEAAGIGVRMVQFIGGEPTMHPDLVELMEYALERDLEVEVFTNLVHIRPQMWELFSRPGVRIATSYYSDTAAEHEQVTKRRGAHARTRANIVEAVRRSVPLRVGVINMGDEQRSDEAVAELAELGVTDVGVDHLREVGRGVRDAQISTDQLCGNCGNGVLAVAADGSVWPCVFSRWLPVGNVLEQPLAAIVAGETATETRRELVAAFAERFSEPFEAACVPKMCNPQCGPSCSPACRPANNCRPVGRCAPDY